MTENELSKIVFDLGLKMHKRLDAGLVKKVMRNVCFMNYENWALRLTSKKFTRSFMMTFLLKMLLELI